MRNLGPGFDERPTIRDVARAAGVAVGTVSRVVNNNRSVAPALRDQVITAIAKLGYERDAVASAMRSNQTFTVACAMRGFNLPGFASFVLAAEAVFQEAGFTLILADTEGKKEAEIRLMRTLIQRRVDGVMMTVADETDTELLQALGRLPFPIVVIDRELPGAFDCVVSDHRSAMSEATDYLLSLGHRRIALVTGSPTLLPARGRIEGFQAAFARAGLKVPESLIFSSSFTNDVAYRVLAGRMRGPNRPTAIIAGGMDLLPGAIRMIRGIGLEIGQDVSLLSGNDSDLAELATPGITATRWDMAAMGTAAAQMLLQQITEQKPGQPSFVSQKGLLVVRGSCRPPTTTKSIR